MAGTHAGLLRGGVGTPTSRRARLRPHLRAQAGSVFWGRTPELLRWGCGRVPGYSTLLRRSRSWPRAGCSVGGTGDQLRRSSARATTITTSSLGRGRPVALDEVTPLPEADLRRGADPTTRSTGCTDLRAAPTCARGLRCNVRRRPPRPSARDRRLNRIVSPQGRASLHLAPGAAYQTRKYPPSARYATADAGASLGVSFRSAATPSVAGFMDRRPEHLNRLEPDHTGDGVSDGRRGP